jgi:hypothetical protein
MSGKIRNPKPEIRMKSETRNPTRIQNPVQRRLAATQSGAGYVMCIRITSHCSDFTGIGGSLM